MIDLGELFPGVQGKPINGNILLPNKYKHLKFLSCFSKKGIKDDLVKEKGVPIGITKTGVDLENRITIRDTSIVKVFQSYPPPYGFTGTQSKQLSCIGNSVPPLLVKAIATQIRHKLFNGPRLEPYPKTMNYPEILNLAWQQRLAPKATDAPSVISTFAGGGGSSLGFSMAGYKELLAVEWDNNAVETLRLNFPDLPIYHGDIAKLSVEECMKLAGVSEGELDLFDGSPPCQGFSTAGKRVMDDPRNQLFREFIRLLRGLKPKVFVMENVSGLVKGKMKLIFVEILKELKASGYEVKVKLLNAMYFNVPQSRQRLIFIGVRNDLGVRPSHPEAESRSITVREAFKDVTKGEYSKPSPCLARIIPKIPPYGDGSVVIKNK